MRALNLKKLDIKVKIALVYSVVLLLMGVAVVLFLSLSLKQSMKYRPVTTTVTYSVVLQSKDSDTIVMYEVPFEHAQVPAEYIISGEQFDSLVSSEIFRRLLIYSAIAVVILLVSTFFLSYKLSRRLLKPLTSMARVTRRITAGNLDLRLDIPESDDELKELSMSFNATIDGLQRAFNDLERFNAYTSHELKNALAVMKTRLEVDYREGDCRETVGFAISQVNRITKTLNDVLAISSTGINDASEPVDLAMAAAQVVDECRATGREIILQIPEEGVLPVRGREIWFQRVIANLVDNAVKHTEEGCSISVSVRQDNEAVVVAVSDSGRGIGCNERELIWEPYFSMASKADNGCGLGLAMVKHIVDICGGHAWVDSNQGQGSTFYISLPVIRPLLTNH
jgi:signal transduction histidine kinase